MKNTTNARIPQIKAICPLSEELKTVGVAVICVVLIAAVVPKKIVI